MGNIWGSGFDLEGESLNFESECLTRIQVYYLLLVRFSEANYIFDSQLPIIYKGLTIL